MTTWGIDKRFCVRFALARIHSPMMTDREIVEALKLISAPRLTMQLIAERCGVSRPLLYYYRDGRPLNETMRRRLQLAFASVKAEGYHIPSVNASSQWFHELPERGLVRR